MADVKISQLPSATLPVAGTEVLPIVQSSLTAKVSISNILSAPNPGNLTFTGTGNRITGDFSNATVASRVMFQNSVANSGTTVQAIPNGTGNTAAWEANNASDATNSGGLRILSTTTDARVDANIRGTGTYVPMTFYTGGSERVRIDTSSNVGIGTSAPAGKFNVGGGRSFFGANSELFSIALGFTQARCNAGQTYYIGATDSATPDLVFSNSAGTERMRVASTGIVTMSAYGVGTATFSAAGVISSVSDETWKIKDGVPVNPDAMLKKLEPGYWYYNDEKKEIFGADRQLGFYAQNVNAAIGPEAAPEPEEGKPWGYYDRSVLAVVVMSLQKALSTIESLETRLAALEQK